MLYRKLGKTGLSVSILGFGCMRLPLKDPKNPESIDEKLSARLLDIAIDNGVNYVDTAYPYHASIPFTRGQSEIFVGKYLKESGKRDKVNLATKLPSWMIQTRSDCDKYLNEQLQRLQTDHIDCYLVHSVSKAFWGNLLKADVFDFLNSAIKDGRIRYAGFSFHDEFPLFKEAVDSYSWSFCQIQYNFMDENYQAGHNGLLYAASKNLGVVVMEPLRGGSLTNNVPPNIRRIWETAKIKRTPAEWAFRYVWNHPEVSLALSGMNKEENLLENLKIAEKGIPNSLTQEELEIIEAVKKEYKARIKVDCTACKYCMPCPFGVNIPECFSIYNNAYMFDDLETAKMRYNLFLGDSKADKCTECGSCVKKCPQHIPIPEKLKEVRAALQN